MKPVIAVSSWSVHRALGRTWLNKPADDTFAEEATFGPGTLSLIELPAALRARGIGAMQLCHFHLASRDPGYLREVRAALADANVTLQSLLIDDGDISDAAVRDRDIAWIGRWVDAAGILGARSARVIAGKQEPTPETLALSVAGLRVLARRGAAADVRILTENWFGLLAGPAEVDAVLDALDGSVGFLADFGNWKGPGKYAALAAVLGRAEDTHAKAHFPTAGAIDGEDFRRCLAAAAEAGYAGPYTLIYESAGDDEWGAVATERAFVENFFAGRA